MVAPRVLGNEDWERDCRGLSEHNVVENVWFEVQPNEENKINNMMKSIVEDTILESSDKKALANRL